MTNRVAMHPRAPSSRSARIVPCIFALMALGLTWPVVAHLSSRIPGTATWAFDESTFVWNIWYFKHALLDLHTSPLHTNLIWYPLGIDLILYTYNLFNALIALPLQVAANLPLASNVTLLMATALSGFGTYLLAFDLLHSDNPTSEGAKPTKSLLKYRLAAVVAGVIYAFASNRAVYAALGHYDMVTTEWLPFYALYLARLIRQQGEGSQAWLKNALLAGFFFALAALAEMIFASFLALFTLVYLAASWRRLQRPVVTAVRLAVAGAVALLIWSPALVPIAREFITGNYALAGWGESLKLSVDAVGLVTPTNLNPLLAAASPGPHPELPPVDGAPSRWTGALRAVEEGQARFSDINTVFLGYVTLALALLGMWTARRRVTVWTWSAVVFALLTLGPLLQIQGRYQFGLDNLLPGGVTFPLPFAFLHYVPFVNANRAPNRNSVILMLALAVLAAYGVAWLIGRIMRLRWSTRHPEGGTARVSPWPLVAAIAAAGVIAVAVVLEHFAVPLPTTDARIPEIYGRIAGEPGDFAVMQLPLGWRNSFGTLGSEQTQLQYYQVANGKPMIGGNISRAPGFKMDYFARIPLFKALTDLEMYRDVDPATDAAARTQAGALMALYDVRYFITTPPIPGRFPYQDTWQRTEQYALQVLPLEKPAFWEQNGFRAYRVLAPAIPFPFRLDLGTLGTEAYLGQGWDLNLEEKPYNATATWAIGTAADLYLPAGQPAAARLRLEIAPLSYEGSPAQTISIGVNGTPVATDRILSSGWQQVDIVVPSSAIRRGPNLVRLAFGWAKSPRRVFPDPASRAIVGTTGVSSPVNLDVHSFSEAYISVFTAAGEKEDGSIGRRGYNIALIDQHTGQILDQRGFDTATNSYEADALAAYLQSIPAGRIVVLATKGDATAHLTQAAVQAFRALGSKVNSVADLGQQAHALVGVRGATPGSAAEVIAPDAFLRVAGDFRSLAAAVDWVELGP